MDQLIGAGPFTHTLLKCFFNKVKCIIGVNNIIPKVWIGLLGLDHLPRYCCTFFNYIIWGHRCHSQRYELCLDLFILAETFANMSWENNSMNVILWSAMPCVGMKHCTLTVVHCIMHVSTRCIVCTFNEHRKQNKCNVVRFGSRCVQQIHQINGNFVMTATPCVAWPFNELS